MARIMMLTASTAHVWTHCALSGRHNDPGSGRPVPAVLELDDEPADTEARREGIAAAWIASAVLRGDAGSVDEMLGEQAPNGWMITPDMVAHVGDYVALVRSHGAPVLAEETRYVAATPVGGPAIVAVRFDAYPLTVDGVLYIYDLKYGYRIVDTYEQLALAAMTLFDANVHTAVELVIFQPRPYHPDGPVRRVRILAEHWLEVAEALRHKALDALAHDAVGEPGPHCRDCSAAGACYALQRAVYAAVDFVGDKRMVHLEPAALARELAFLEVADKLVKTRLSAMQAETIGRIQNGEFVPGRYLEQRLGDREFTVPLEQVMFATGISPFKTVGKSPAELEKEGADKNVIATMTRRAPAGRRLATVSKSTFARMFPSAKS
jgi:hypothetical protein